MQQPVVVVELLRTDDLTEYIILLLLVPLEPYRKAYGVEVLTIVIAADAPRSQFDSLNT